MDFKRICAYCERYLELSTGRVTIDHFRPRYRFPNLWLDWPNLMYACHRCNQVKGNSWPGFDDQDSDGNSKAKHPRYRPISEYVSPNAEAEKRPASAFFSYDVETGEILPAEQLSDEEWSTAFRTIADIELNDADIAEYDQGQLRNLRRNQLRLVIQKLSSIQDRFLMRRMAQEFTLPNKPFSSFVAAYLRLRFPEL